MNYFNIQLRRIVGAAQSIAGKGSFDVLFISNRPEYFDASEFTNLREGLIKSLTFISSVQQLINLKRTFDIAILCSHITTGDQDVMFQIRAKNLADFLFVWTYDNHHNHSTNLAVNALTDVVVPAHKFNANYMRTPCTLLGQHVPIGVMQWSRVRAKRFFSESAHLQRKDGLHGGFISWEIGEREELIKNCQALLPGNAINLIASEARQNYFGQTPEQRWHDWASYKTGFILPLTVDLSGRLFDSLIAGQVPIVPTWCRDLDEVISADLQNSLPIIRFDTPSVEAVDAAWRSALQRFDTDGPAGALRRHVYAVENHHAVNRIQSICKQVKSIAKSTDIGFAYDAEGVGFVLAAG